MLSLVLSGISASHAAAGLELAAVPRGRLERGGLRRVPSRADVDPAACLARVWVVRHPVRAHALREREPAVWCEAAVALGLAEDPQAAIAMVQVPLPDAMLSGTVGRRRRRLELARLSVAHRFHVVVVGFGMWCSADLTDDRVRGRRRR